MGRKSQGSRKRQRTAALQNLRRQAAEEDGTNATNGTNEKVRAPQVGKAWPAALLGLEEFH